MPNLPKPTALKILQGNPGQRPLPQNEPIPSAGVPRCPSWLPAAGKREWKRLAKEMGQIGLLTRCDLGVFASYSLAWSRIQEAEKHLKKSSDLTQDTTGGGAPSAWLKVQNNAMLQIRQFGVELGLTPSARSRIEVDKGGPEDEFGEFLKAAKRVKRGQPEKCVERYIRDVLRGKIKAGKLERQCVQRHVRDLEHGAGRGLRFDDHRARMALLFAVTFIKHTKGEWAGQRLELAPWFAFVLWSLFGWQREQDGRSVRRFRYAYVSMGRKNAKTFLAAVVGLFMLAGEGEHGAEVYAAATKRDQARLTWSQAAAMVRRTSKGLQARIRINESRSNMAMLSTDSKFEALGADADTMDGLNPYCAIVDELHAHKKPDTYNVLRSGMGARAEPLLFAITTAGSSTEGICRDQDRKAEQILGEVIEDDATFSFIARLDKDDDYWDEANWRKANPNLGLSVKLQGLRDDALEAKQNPGYLNEFLRKRMNLWTQAQDRAISPEAWAACDRPVLVEPGSTCMVGLDLSSKIDLTAAVAVFTHADGSYSLLPHFWCPEETLAERCKRDGVPYDLWRDAGYLTATDGNMVDHESVRKKINEWGEFFHVPKVAYDDWNSTQMAVWLQEDGFDLVEVRQGFKSMSEPCKTFQALVGAGRIRHGGNPVLRWMADNLEFRVDSNDNVAPMKGKNVQKNRIDGMVASIMGLKMALLAEADEDYSELVVLG